MSRVKKKLIEGPKSIKQGLIRQYVELVKDVEDPSGSGTIWLKGSVIQVGPQGLKTYLEQGHKEWKPKKNVGKSIKQALNIKQ